MPDRDVPPGDPPEAEEEPGADAVRAALGRARAAAAAKGLSPSVGSGSGRVRPAGTAARRGDADARSGAHPDARDPQAFGTAVRRLVTERGWSTPVAVGGVFGRWDQVVGADIAGHCQPESFEKSVLVVRADSTAWATQIRLLAPMILRRLEEELGRGVVERLQVKGPGGPSWLRGRRTAPGGRGPRDTYG
ncbi:MAG: DUF721 domain-containing protein [Actinomycetes bacterium]